MNSQNRRETAMILQFPASGRSGRSGRVPQAIAKQNADVFDNSTYVTSGAWYHEAAIVEADRSRKS